MRLSIFTLFFVASVALFACGGGSSDSGMLIEGLLDEGSGAEHSAAAARHSAGERIEEVKICALGECSTTDGQGQWGFVADPGFEGGDVVFTIEGHGIDSQAFVHIPHGAREVFIHLRHENGTVIMHHMLVDGAHSEEVHGGQYHDSD